jgi:hypothetical protein
MKELEEGAMNGKILLAIRVSLPVPNSTVSPSSQAGGKR